MTHPLTDDFCHRIAESWPPDAAEKDNMRSAADWQLEQVNAWIDKNAHLYIDSDNLWTLVYMLKEDLNKTMRPTNEINDQLND